MAWLIEAFNNDSDIIEITSEQALLEATDPVRKQILKDAQKTVLDFLHANGINTGANKVFINSKFKQGKTNDIQFIFSIDMKTLIPLSLVVSNVIALTVNYIVTEKNYRKIKELLKDPKKEAELNALLKKNCKAKVVVKSFKDENTRIILTYEN